MNTALDSYTLLKAPKTESSTDPRHGINELTDGPTGEAQPYSPPAPVKANVYLFTPTLPHIETSGTLCAVTLLALDGQTPEEM